MRALFDLLGLGVIILLVIKAWGLWQIQDAPALEVQPVLSRALSSDSGVLKNDITSVVCTRKAPLLWEDAVRMACVVEGPKAFGVTLSAETELRLDPNEPVFDFEVRRSSRTSELKVSAGIDKESVFPSTATRLLKKRLQQVQDSLETPTGGKLRDAKSEAERKRAVKEAWGDS